MTIEEYNKLKESHNTPNKKQSSFEESNIQAEFFGAVKLIFPQLDKLIFHIPNEGKRNFRYVKSSGIKRGVADVFLSISNKKYHGLYIELKTSNGKQTKDQELFQQQVEKVGYQYKICRTANDAIGIVKQYLK